MSPIRPAEAARGVGDTMSRRVTTATTPDTLLAGASCGTAG